MKSGNVAVFVVSLVVGILFVTAMFVLFILRYVRNLTARMRADLENEGIVLDTGPQWITIRYSGFRAPGFARGVGYAKTRASLILTQRRLAVVPARWRHLLTARADLGRFSTGVAEDGLLRIHSDDPPNASGSIDFRVPVSDPGPWVRALIDAGAKPL